MVILVAFILFTLFFLPAIKAAPILVASSAGGATTSATHTLTSASSTSSSVSSLNLTTIFVVVGVATAAVVTLTCVATFCYVYFSQSIKEAEDPTEVKSGYFGNGCNSSDLPHPNPYLDCPPAFMAAARLTDSTVSEKRPATTLPKLPDGVLSWPGACNLSNSANRLEKFKALTIVAKPPIACVSPLSPTAHSLLSAVSADACAAARSSAGATVQPVSSAPSPASTVVSATSPSSNVETQIQSFNVRPAKAGSQRAEPSTPSRSIATEPGSPASVWSQSSGPCSLENPPKTNFNFRSAAGHQVWLTTTSTASPGEPHADIFGPKVAAPSPRSTLPLKTQNSQVKPANMERPTPHRAWAPLAPRKRLTTTSTAPKGSTHKCRKPAVQVPATA